MHGVPTSMTSAAAAGCGDVKSAVYLSQFAVHYGHGAASEYQDWELFQLDDHRFRSLLWCLPEWSPGAVGFLTVCSRRPHATMTTIRSTMLERNWTENRRARLQRPEQLADTTLSWRRSSRYKSRSIRPCCRLGTQRPTEQSALASRSRQQHSMLSTTAT